MNTHRIMKRIEFIQKYYDAESDRIKNQSALLLLNGGANLGGENKSSGDVVENYLKSIIARHLPSHRRICSGYIATSDSMHKEERLSQHDLIVYDSRIPPLCVTGVGDICIVAAESVCAIFEIKRTLSVSTTKTSIEALRKTKNDIETYKLGKKHKSRVDADGNPWCDFSELNSPFYGVLGLEIESDADWDKFHSGDLSAAVIEFVDIVWAVSSEHLTFHCLKKDEHINSAPDNVCRNRSDYMDFSLSTSNCKDNKRHAITAMAIARIRDNISRISGVEMSAGVTAKYLGLME